MRLRLALAVVSVLWMLGAGWHQLEPVIDEWTDPLLQQEMERREARFADKLKDCKGEFSKKYECKTALFLEYKQDLFFRWSGIVGVVFGPPLGLVFGYWYYLHRRDEAAEAERQRTRVARLAREAVERRQRAIEEGRRRTEEARRKLEAKRAAAVGLPIPGEGTVPPGPALSVPSVGPAEAPPVPSVTGTPQKA